MLLRRYIIIKSSRAFNHNSYITSYSLIIVIYQRRSQLFFKYNDLSMPSNSKKVSHSNRHTHNPQLCIFDFQLLTMNNCIQIYQIVSQIMLIGNII